jgi:hypothetical protein
VRRARQGLKLAATIRVMSRLESELQRLYPAQDGEQVRAMVLELARPASWSELSRVWQGVQADLELPAPVIAVNGKDGYQLWFSFAQPLPAAQASAFLESLRRRYLADVPRDRIAFQPPNALLPIEAGPGHWSAFVAPDLASLFGDEPWLDLPPSADAQADLLSRIESIQAKDWQRAVELLRPAPTAQTTTQPSTEASSADPKRFLLAVMNDPTIDMHLRIEAAKALLPYFA